MTTRLLRRLAGITSTVVLAMGGLMVFVPITKVSAAQDCDANAVIYCGVTSLPDLAAKYRQNQGGNLQAIFGHFGIPNEAYFSDMQSGKVTKSGDVYLGNQLVATGAVTAGRQYMPGSTKIPGVEAYKRPPSVSFRSESLDAFVKMTNGSFAAAVIKSCGNPVNAVPVYKPAPPPAQKPQPQPQPQPLPSRPELSIEKEVRLIDESSWQKQVTADPGESIEYRIVVTNTGDTDLQDVRIRDSLPTFVSFKDAALRGSGGIGEFTAGDLVGNGVKIDSLRVGGRIEILFVVTVGSQADACGVPLKNVAYASANEAAEVQDYALVRVCQPRVAPAQKQMPSTGAGGVIAAFPIVSSLGFALYKLKEFFARSL